MFLFLLLAGMAALVIAAENPPQVKLVKGDPVAGQKVFAEMKCYTCHYLAGPEGQQYKNPVSTAPAPLLDRSKLAEQTAQDVATSIVEPSHTVSSVIVEQSGGKLSPMASFSGLLNQQQLSDLVAYLRSTEETKTQK
jgi:mono/diheme cytochrome c family protein